MSGWNNHKLGSRLLRELSIITDYADDTTLMGESIEELKTLWMKMKKQIEKVGLKLSNKTTKIMASDPHFMAKEGVKVEAVTDFLSLGSKISADGNWSHEIERRLFLGRKAMINLQSENVSHI